MSRKLGKRLNKEELELLLSMGMRDLEDLFFIDSAAHSDFRSMARFKTGAAVNVDDFSQVDEEYIKSTMSDANYKWRAYTLEDR